MPTVVITTEPIFQAPGPHVDILRKEGFEVRFPREVPLLTESVLLEAMHKAEAVIAGGSDPYNASVLDRLPDLRVIARFGVGYERVDVEAATKRGIAVTITPNGNHEAVAEHAMAFLLALTRHIVRNDRDVRQGRWEKDMLIPLRGKTLGIVGLGRIGKSLAVRAAAFKLHVLAYDPYPDIAFAREREIEFVDLDTLLARSDFVSLHLPLTPETRGIIDRTRLSRMKPGSFLINTARGGLVAEDDLVSALQSGHLAGAGLDVFAQEPPPLDHPLFALEKVVLAPHVAAGDTQSVHDMAMGSAQNIIDLYRGNWPAASVVNPALRNGWKWQR